MKKKDIRFLIIFVIIVGVSFIYLFQSSYAKYRRNSSTVVQGRIASWNIKVNTETINNKQTLTNSITPTIDSNQYVKSGTLAPGSTGSFEIDIDATDVDVDFTYTISGSIAQDTPLLDLKLTHYKIGTGTKTELTGNITGDIVKNTPSTKITIYFEWDDSNTNQMNNAQDTAYATNELYENTKINVSLHFQQKNS